MMLSGVEEAGNLARLGSGAQAEPAGILRG